MDDDPSLSEDLLRVALGVKRMADFDPPESLLGSVMEAVQSRRRPWWYRLHRWARAPRSITLTPLQALPAVAILVALCVAPIFYLSGKGAQHVYQAQLQVVPAERQGFVPVKLSLRLPEAHSVAVVGSFNGWHAGECSMQRELETWTIVLNLPTGRYEYGFMVDGKNIIPDPGASIYQDDGFGNQNAVLIVGNHEETAI